MVEFTSTIDRELDSQRYVETLQDKTIYGENIGGFKPDGWEDYPSSYTVVYIYTLFYQGRTANPLPNGVIAAIETGQFDENSEMGVVKTTWYPLNDNTSSHIIIRVNRLLTNKVFNVNSGYVSLGYTMDAIEQFNQDVIHKIISWCAQIIASSPQNEVGAASPVLIDRVREINRVSGEPLQKWVEGHKEGELILSETLRTETGTETRETNIDTGEQKTSELKAVDVHLQETGQIDEQREVLPDSDIFQPVDREIAPDIDLFDPEYNPEFQPEFDEQPSEDAFTARKPKGFFATAVDSAKSIFNALFRR